MADPPTEDEQDRSDDTAKLELPSLSLPRLRRRKRARPEEPPPEDTEDTALLRQPEPTPVPAAEPESAPVPEPRPVAAPEDAAEPEEPEDAGEPAAREPFRLPPLPGRAAAVATGLLVGVAGALLTYLSLRGCEAVRGTESCGGGGGLLLLVVILVLMVFLGGFVLSLWDVGDARATSFLAVGVLCVTVMLTLMQQLFSPWMFLVLPVLSMLAYLLAHWVTTAFIEPTPEKGPQHDVR
jgi:hypothetical protein